MKTLLFALTLVPAAFSQAPTAPPPIVRIACEPGYSTVPAKPYEGAKAAVEVLGMSADTGQPQTWTIELHETFASIEDLDKALSVIPFAPVARDAYGQPQEDLLAGPRTMIALYEKEWSYRPDEAAAPKQADLEIGREHLLFRVEPRLSYVSGDFAAGDETFWRGKQP